MTGYDWLWNRSLVLWSRHSRVSCPLIFVLCFHPSLWGPVRQETFCPVHLLGMYLCYLLCALPHTTLSPTESLLLFSRPCKASYRCHFVYDSPDSCLTANIWSPLWVPARVTVYLTLSRLHHELHIPFSRLWEHTINFEPHVMLVRHLAYYGQLTLADKISINSLPFIRLCSWKV